MALWKALGLKEGVRDLLNGNLGGWADGEGGGSSSSSSRRSHHSQQHLPPPPPMYGPPPGVPQMHNPYGMPPPGHIIMMPPHGHPPPPPPKQPRRQQQPQQQQRYQQQQQQQQFRQQLPPGVVLAPGHPYAGQVIVDDSPPGGPIPVLYAAGDCVPQQQHYIVVEDQIGAAAAAVDVCQPQHYVVEEQKQQHHHHQQQQQQQQQQQARVFQPSPQKEQRQYAPSPPCASPTPNAKLRQLSEASNQSTPPAVEEKLDETIRFTANPLFSNGPNSKSADPLVSMRKPSDSTNNNNNNNNINSAQQIQSTGMYQSPTVTMDKTCYLPTMSLSSPIPDEKNNNKISPSTARQPIVLDTSGKSYSRVGEQGTGGKAEVVSFSDLKLKISQDELPTEGGGAPRIIKSVVSDTKSTPTATTVEANGEKNGAAAAAVRSLFPATIAIENRANMMMGLTGATAAMSLGGAVVVNVGALSVQQLCQWLASIELPQDKIEVFKTQGVNGLDLLHLTDEEMTDDLQLTKLQVKKIRRAIAAAQDPSAAAATGGGGEDLEISLDLLKWNEIIGHGTYKTVYRGLYGGAEVALGLLREGISDVNAFRQELQVFSRLRHPNVVALFGACLACEPPVIVTEYCAGGSLFHHLHESKTNFSRDERLSICVDILRGLTYMHSNRIAHRDMKPHNVLLSIPLRAKLVDFGVSRAVGVGQLAATAVGTPLYMAPEVGGGVYDPFAADIYSAALTLFETATGTVVYPQVETVWQLHTLVAVQKVRPPIHDFPELSSLFVELIEKMWHPEPTQRGSAMDALKILDPNVGETGQR